MLFWEPFRDLQQTAKGLPASIPARTSAMKTEVRLFAGARQLARTERVTLDVPAGSTAAEIRAALAASVPALRPLLPHMLVAVDNQYVDDADPIGPEAEIALIPPVSGG